MIKATRGQVRSNTVNRYDHRSRCNWSVIARARQSVELADRYELPGGQLPRYRHDLSRVRIHTDRRAAESARALGARAYTIGSDIYFGAGEYRPGTREGRRLIAHELAHVAQQRGAAASAPGAPDNSAEREAVSVAERVARGEAAPPIRQAVSAGTVQRQVDDTDGAPIPAQIPSAGWTPTHPSGLSIYVESDKSSPRDRYGSASSRGTVALSSNAHIEHFCSSPGSFPLTIRFYIDSMTLPRPHPFQAPAVSVGFSYVPEGATAPSATRTARDTAPRYHGPGYALAPSFGTAFSFMAHGSGMLNTRAELLDQSSGVRISYVDRICCYLAPCA